MWSECGEASFFNFRTARSWLVMDAFKAQTTKMADSSKQAYAPLDKDDLRSGRMKISNSLEEVRQGETLLACRAPFPPAPAAHLCCPCPAPCCCLLLPLQKISTEWRKDGLKVCDESVRKYWVCRQETGLMVVFKCREENKVMHECLQQHARNKPAYEAYKTQRLAEMQAEKEKRQAQAAAPAAAAAPGSAAVAAAVAGGAASRP